jgi:hypothetical protein
VSISKLLKYIDRFENSIDELEKSIKWIQTKTDNFDRWIVKDAIAKRFETSLEYFWKMLKIASMFQGTEVPSLGLAIQAAMQHG